MSRAIFVALSEAEVIAACAKHGASISVIEPLAGGGSRVVFTNGDAAADMRQVFARKLLSPPAARSWAGATSA